VKVPTGDLWGPSQGEGGQEWLGGGAGEGERGEVLAAVSGGRGGETVFVHSPGVAPSVSWGGDWPKLQSRSTGEQPGPPEDRASMCRGPKNGRSIVLK